MPLSPHPSDPYPSAPPSALAPQGSRPAASGIFPATYANAPSVGNATNLSPGLLYDIYLVASDQAANKQTSVTSILWVQA